MYTKDYPAKELTDSVPLEMTYSVAVEDTIELFVNNIHMAAILATPEMLKELALGYLICEGVVKAPGEIKNMRIVGKAIHVQIETNEDFELWRELRSSGCVGVRWEENEEVGVTSGSLFDPDAIKR